MNYELAKKAQKIAEKISIQRFGTKAMAELCLPEAYEQIRKDTNERFSSSNESSD